MGRKIVGKESRNSNTELLITTAAKKLALAKATLVQTAANAARVCPDVLMSVLFIAMYARRGGMEGQSLLLAAAKWIGTLAPTILFDLYRIADKRTIEGPMQRYMKRDKRFETQMVYP